MLRFFFIYFTITWVKKIIHYIKDFDICDPIWEKGDEGEFRKQRSNTFNRLRRKAWKRILYAFTQIFNAFKQPALLHFNIAFRMLESKLI